MAKLLASSLEVNPPPIISKFGTTACLYDEARHCVLAQRPLALVLMITKIYVVMFLTILFNKVSG